MNQQEQQEQKEQIQQKLDVVIPEWAKEVKKESIESALKYGDILPSVQLPEVNQTILVKFLEEPRLIEHDKLPNGQAVMCKVQHMGAEMQMVIPNSLSFSIVKEMNRLNLTSLTGVKMVIGAKLTDMSDKGYMKETKVYWCQIKEGEA